MLLILLFNSKVCLRFQYIAFVVSIATILNLSIENVISEHSFAIASETSDKNLHERLSAHGIGNDNILKQDRIIFID